MGYGGAGLTWNAWEHFSPRLECIIIIIIIIIDAEPSLRDIFSDFRTSVWSCYGNFLISYDSIMSLGLIFRFLMTVK